MVIFDMDGTLIDSFRDLQVTLNEVRIALGLEVIDQKKIKDAIGASLKGMISKLFEEDKDKISQALDMFKVIYKKHIVDNTIPYNRIVTVLEQLKKSGIMIGVLSNKPSELVRIPLYHFNLSYLMDFIYGGDSFDERKPSGVPIKRIINYFEVKPENAIIIGDSPIDILAGKDAKIKTMAVTYGYSNEKELKRFNPDFIVNFPLEILEKLSE
jgi:phosphoglycolate phosphatase